MNVDFSLTNDPNRTKILQDYNLIFELNIPIPEEKRIGRIDLRLENAIFKR